MEPLDLTKRPPRSPWDRLDGLIMMPRTIDKLRAQLPGGNIGAYKVAGTSKRLLDALGIDETDLQSIVALVATDDEVAVWLRRHADPNAYESVNALLGERRLKDMDLEDIYTRYPIAKTLPVETKLLDMLDADDAAMFGRDIP